ncbi:MAG: thiamine pyrophosphate-dependent enzyme [Acidimicrobiia bacterium]
MTTGRDILFDVLVSEGVHHCFGNPGTTELPFIDELAVRAGISYVLALQENVAVAMADGYAQASRRPAFVNLHTSAGLGGGMGNLTNAAANHTPLVVTAGQQDRRHLVSEPILAGDLVGLARAATKWQHEVRHAGELGTILRRAFLDCGRPPAGPVFVSIPMDVLDEETDTDAPPRSRLAGGAVGGSLDELAELLTGPGSLAIVVGDEVAAAGPEAVASMVALAEATGAPVFGTPLYSNLNFPSTHPLWKGMLGFTAAAISEALGGFQRVFLAGGKAFLVYPWSPGPPLPASVELLHLSASAGEVGHHLPVRLGVVGDVGATLAALVPLVAAVADQGGAFTALAGVAQQDADSARLAEAVTERAATIPMEPLVAVHAVLEAVPTHAALVDEAITTGPYVRNLMRLEPPGSYYFCRGGGLGWGIPAALGVKLAQPGTPVVCVVGDGSALYTIQALWTAAHAGIPVVVVVVNNRSYAILKNNLAGMGGHAARTGRFVGMDLDQPPVDYVGLSRSLGVDADLISKPDELTGAVVEGLASDRPLLLEVPIAAPGSLG